MSAESDYLENALLDHVLGGPDYVRPSDVYVALFTAAPTDAGGGTEVSGGSYARLAITNDATNFPAASGGTKSNGTVFAFATPTGDWGTVVSCAVFDDPTAGNLLYHGPLNPEKTILSGQPARFAVGTMQFVMD